MNLRPLHDILLDNELHEESKDLGVKVFEVVGKPLHAQVAAGRRAKKFGPESETIRAWQEDLSAVDVVGTLIFASTQG